MPPSTLLSAFFTKIGNIQIEITDLNPNPDYCRGDSVDVTFETTGSFDSSNTYDLVLYREGQIPATQGTTIASIDDTSDATISAKIPDTIDQRSDYRFRIIASDPVVISEPMDSSFAIFENPEITAMEDTTICYGSTIPLQAQSDTNATYQWTPTPSLDDSAAQNPLATPLQTTTYTATATNPGGCQSKDSVTINTTPQDTTRADTPAIIRATYQDDNTRQIDFPANSDSSVHQYTLYASERGEDDFFVVNDTTTASDTDLTLTHNGDPGVAYCYYITQGDTCDVRTSEPSALHCPPNPQALASNCKDSVQINWQPYKGWENIEEYRIYRSADGGSYQHIATTQDTAITDTTPDLNADNCYQIEAVNQADTTVTAFSVTTCAETFEASPQKVHYASKTSSSTTNGTIEVAFDTSNTHPFVGHRHLYLKESGGNFSLLRDNIPLSQDTVVLENQNTKQNSQTIYMTRVDECGIEGVAKDTHRTMNIDVTVGQLKHDLSWTAYEGFKNWDYVIERSSGSGFNPVDTVPQNDTSYTFSPAPCNTPIFYRIRAVEDQYTALSDTAGETAIDTIPPDAPEITHLTINNDQQAEIDYTGADSLDIFGYSVRRIDTGASEGYVETDFTLFTEQSQQEQSIDSMPFATGQQPCYKVVAQDSCLNETPSQQWCAIKLNGQEQNLQNYLSWQAFQGFTIEQYIVQREENGTWQELDTLTQPEWEHTDEDLPCNIPQTYRIRGEEDGGSRITYSNTIELTPFDTTAPAAPEVERLTVQGDTALLGEWQLSDDQKVDRYEVQLQQDDGTWQVADTTGADSQYVFNNADPVNSKYCFRVVAIDSCADNRSEPSMQHCSVQLEGTAQNLQNHLDWSEYEGFDGEEYVVKRKENGTWQVQDTVTTTEYTDSPLPCNIEQTYRITTNAVNEEQQSLSNTINLTPFDTTAPATPEIDRLTVQGDTALMGEWQLSDDKVDRYELQLKVKDSTWQTMDTTGVDSQYTFNAVDPLEETYCFRVVAIDSCADNRSEPAARHCHIPLDGTAGNLQNDLDWEAYEGFDSTAYVIENEENGTWQSLDTVSITEYSHEPVPCDVAQNYRIKALEAEGENISYSHTRGLTPFDTLAPAVPEITTASVLNDTATAISWSTPEGDDGKYTEVYRIDQDDTTLVDTVIYENEFTDTDLQNDTQTYSYFVEAIDSCEAQNRSAPSDPHTTILQDSITTGACQAEHRLEWSAYEGYGEDTEYIIYREDYGETPFRPVDTVESQTYTDSNVVEDSTYCYQIAAYDSATEDTAASNTRCQSPVIFPDPDTTAIERTTVERTSENNGSVLVEWEQADVTDTLLQGYFLYHSTFSQEGPFDLVADIEDSTQTEFLHEGIDTRNDEHYYRVVAYNVCVEESITREKHSPINLMLENNNLEADLEWTQYLGFEVEQYELQRRVGDGNFQTREIFDPEDTTYADTMVSCGEEYSWRVIGHNYTNNLQTISDSVWATAYDTLPPEQAEIRRATYVQEGPNAGEIDVDFLPATDRNRKGYSLYHAPLGDPFSNLEDLDTGTTEELTWPTGIDEANGPHGFYITSYDSCDNVAAPSDSHQVVQLEATTEDGQNLLEWTPYEGWQDITYELQRAGGDDEWQTLTTTEETLEYTDEQVRCDSTYNYRVVASSANHDRVSYSNLAQLTAIDTRPPEDPELTRVTVEETTPEGDILIEWPDDEEIYYYEVERRTDGAWQTVEEEVFDDEFTDQMVNTTEGPHEYRIRAVDSCLNVSEEYSPIHRSIYLEALSQETQVSLSWTEYGGEEVEEYRILRDGEELAQTEDTEWTDEDALCGDEYAYRIEAELSNGEMSHSNLDTARVGGVPPEPVKLQSAGMDENQEEVVVQWSASESHDVEGYKVYREVQGQIASQEVADIPADEELIYREALPEAGTRTCYYVAPYNHCEDEGELSNAGCVIMPGGETGDFENHLTWSDYQEWSEVAAYRIFKSIDEGPYVEVAEIPGDSTNYTDTELEIDIQDYCYYVEADHPEGYIARSTEVCLQQSPVVYIPNSFSPGTTTGLNEEFGPQGTYIADYDMQIYNRWGQLIYETEDGEKWEGKAGDEGIVPTGNYLYRITIYGYNGEREFYSGSVSVVD